MQYSSLHGELQDLIQRLSVMVKVYKEHLVALTQIVIPALPHEKTVDLIQELLLLPSFFSTQTAQQLEALVAKPPIDHTFALPFRLLLDIREVQSVLKGVTQVQLLRLLDNMPSDNSLRQQLDFLINLQEVFMSWSSKNLTEYSKKVLDTPANLQRQTLLVLAPKIQHSVVKLVVELFALPAAELESFKVWLDNLPYNRLVLLVNLLSMQDLLLEVHSRLTSAPVVGSKRSYIDSLDISEGFSSLLIEPAGKLQRLGSSTDELRRMVSLPPTEFDYFLDESLLGSAFPEFDFDDFSMQDDLVPQTQDRPGSSPPTFPNSPAPVSLSPLNRSLDGFGMDIEHNNAFDSPLFDFMGVSTTLDFPFQPANYQVQPYTLSLIDSNSSVPTSMLLPATVAATQQQQQQPVAAPSVPSVPSVPSLPSMPTLDTMMNIQRMPPPTNTNFPTNGSATIPVPTTSMAATSRPAPVAPMMPALQPNKSPTGAQLAYRLTVTTQPPPQTVYQRILKPFPAVTLHHSGSASLNNLFVEASLIRSDELKELPKCLEGTRVVPLGPSLFTAFKKLKILATSQQQGTTFRIMFQLKRYEESVFHTIPGVAVLSNPIEVYSHTYYLPNRRRNAAAAPPMLTEVIPPVGKAQGGDKIVLLGVNFVESDKLLVAFGDTHVKPVFHESNALICTTPRGFSGLAVTLQVANDGANFCQSESTASALCGL